MTKKMYSQQQCETLKGIDFAHLIVDEQNHLLSITLNRPEKKNALNNVLMRELAFVLTHAKYNNNIWAVVINANGDVFCAGADLKSFMNGSAETTTSTVPAPAGEIILGNVFNQLHKPCIAKVHAPVYAGGFLIVCGCTHVIASPSASFGLPEVKRGIWPFQVMQSLLQIMPARTVLDFCMRAKTVNATQAQQLGLVTEVADAENLNDAVQQLVNEIFENSPSAIRLGLKAYQELKEKSYAEAHAFLMKCLSETIKTNDAAEGIAAFAEKRKPNWQGE